MKKHRSTPKRRRPGQAPGSAPVEVHIRGWREMPKETQDALVQMFTIIADRAAKGLPLTKDEEKPRLCSNCKHGGREAKGLVRCVHPHWDEIGEPKASTQRDISPDFAEECSDYEQNTEVSNRAAESAKKPTA